MKINFPATRQKMSVVNLSAWARSYGFNPTTVRRILADEEYPPGGPTYTRVMNQLRLDGYLVEEPEDQAAA